MLKLLGFEYRTVTQCPCEAWQVDWLPDVTPQELEAVLMEHMRDCVVAQAALIAHLAVDTPK